jgi:hypothetical protein
LTLPANVAEIGCGVFSGVTTIECVTLVGCSLSSGVVRAVHYALAGCAKVISPALAGRAFGRFVIVATP